MPWLKDFRYRKTNTISRSAGSVTDYQVVINVGESSGSSGDDVHCEGRCKTDFADLRFTNSAGTVLNHWIESISGTTPNQTAKVWVKFDTIGSSATTFHMYYGNDSATSTSSGPSTMIVQEDFNGGFRMTWNVVSGTWSRSDSSGYDTAGYYRESSGGASGSINTTWTAFVDGFHLTVAVYCENDINYGPHVGFGDDKAWTLGFFPSSNLVQAYRPGGSTTAKIQTINASTWYVIDFYITDEGYWYYYVDGNLKDSGLDNTENTWSWLSLYTEYTVIRLDRIIMRKYRAGAITFGAWGSEEDGNNPLTKYVRSPSGLLWVPARNRRVQI